MGDRAPKRAKAAAAGAGIDGAGTATAPASLLDVSDFERIRGEMQRYDEQREKIIKTSRDVQKLSKHAIFALHRRDESKADDQLNKAMEIAKELHPLIANEPNLRYGSYSNAMEEYAEARLFQGWLREGRLLPISQIEGTSNEEYLGGVLDFCGELNRLSVARATARDVDAVRRSRDLVEDVMAEYLKFEFRNGGLRKKYDGLKYVLKNHETMLYELSLSMNRGPGPTKQEPGLAENGSG